MKYGIVGFDPGTTSAIAVIDLEGGILLAKSFAGISQAEAVEKIRQACTPAIFASDVSPPQEAVRRLAAAFGCRAWAPPDIPLSIEEKKRVVAENTEGGFDVHERDALAAAFSCLFSIGQMAERARRKSPESWEERLFLVLKGEARNLTEEEMKILEPKRTRKREPDFLRIRLLKERVASLEEEAERLKGRLADSLKSAKEKRNFSGGPLQRQAVIVENKAALEAAVAVSEMAQRTLKETAGRRVVVLERGEQAGDRLFVKTLDGLGAAEIIKRKIKVIVCEESSPAAASKLPCRIVKLRWQSLFEGRFAIVPEDELSLTKEEERRWAEAYLAFVSGRGARQ